MLVVVVILPHWRFLLCRLFFLTTSTPPWLLRPDLHLLYFCQAFPSHFTASAMVFAHRQFLPCAPTPQFDTFYDSDAGRNTPSRIFLHACLHRAVSYDWCMVLNYSYCRFKAIGLSIVPVSLEI